MEIKLKFWMAGPVLRSVCSVVAAMFDRLLAAIGKLTLLTDAETCPAPLLALLAWQRGIERLAGEDDALFRRRVKYAFENALDAGSVAGFERIWQRLQLGSVNQQERAADQDWDVILVTLDDSKFSHYRGLFEALVLLYGRTCRRYVMTQPETPGDLGIRPFEFSCTMDNCKAVY